MKSVGLRYTRQAVELVFGIGPGLALVTYALLSGSDWAVLIGTAGLMLAGHQAIRWAKRLGATDQPQ
jgi:hypothetical protein